jgi:hypothetical protein
VSAEQSVHQVAAAELSPMLGWSAETITRHLERLREYGDKAVFYVWWVMSSPISAKPSKLQYALRCRYIYVMDSLLGLTDDIRNRTLALDSFRCRNCHYESYEFADLTVDHMLPRSRGGGNEQANLQVLCRRCNSSKGAMTQDEWESSGLALKQRQLRKWPECMR